MAEFGYLVWFGTAAVAPIMALLVGHFGLAGRAPRPISLGRVLGAGLIRLGVPLFLGLR